MGQLAPALNTLECAVRARSETSLDEALASEEQSCNLEGSGPRRRRNARFTLSYELDTQT